MKATASPSLWRPLEITVFRNLLIADIVSDAGAFMMPGLTAWQGLFEPGRLHAGQRVLVHGAAGFNPTQRIKGKTIIRVRP